MNALRSRKFMAVLSLIATGSLIAVQASAQTAVSTTPPTTTATSETIVMEKVVATGSRLNPPEFEGAIPVNVYTSAEISRSTAESINNYLRTIPTSYGADNVDESFVNGGDGRATIGLRGLPTLTLVNGRRTATDDLNMIPLAAVDRIEILKDGNGAVYGADAVGGVVNIITKKKFEGVQVDIAYQNTETNDISRRRAEVVWGQRNDRGSVILGLSYFKQNDLFSKDRDEVTETSDRSFAATSSIPNPGRFNLTPAQALAMFGHVNASSTSYRLNTNLAAATSPASFRRGQYGLGPVATSDRFPFALYTPTVRPADRYTIFGSTEYDVLKDTVRIYGDIFYTRANSQAGLAPSPASFSGTSSAATDFRIPAGYYWNQQIFGASAVDITSWNYRFLDFGPRNNDVRFDDTAITLGVKGNITDRWGYDLSWFYNKNEQLDIERNGVNRDRLRQILQGTNTTFTGARSFNPFTNPFETGVISNDAQMLEFIKLEPRTTRDNITTIKTATFNGKPFDLPAGSLEALVGIERRNERFIRTPDLAKQQASGSGWNATSAFRQDFTVDSLFGEVIVPVLADAPFAQKLQVGAAIRREKFSHLPDKATIGRVYVRDQVNKELTLRASYSEGYTAPEPGDLDPASFQSFPNIYFPWLGVADQTNLGVTFLGNAGLKPSTSKSINAGVVYSPKGVRGLSITVDYYNVEREDIITQDAQALVDLFAQSGGITAGPGGTFVKNNSAPFASQIDVDLNGATTGIPGYIISISNVPTANIASLKATGLDFDIAYNMPTDNFGNLSFRLNMTHTLSYEIQKLPGLTVDYAGFYTPNDDTGPETIPRWRGFFEALWDYKGFSTSAKMNYIGEYKEDPAGGQVFSSTIDAWPTYDVTVAYTIKRTNTRIMFGVENVFDDMPPRALSSFADKYDRSAHNILGRMFTLKATQKF